MNVGYPHALLFNVELYVVLSFEVAPKLNLVYTLE
jgi:hypothetical protein